MSGGVPTPHTTAAEYGSRLKARTTARNLFLSKLPLQLDLGALQPLALSLRQRLAGTVDIECQHRQRRAVGAGLAARTVFSRALQRGRDLLRAGEFEDALLEIERVAFAGH